MRRLVWRATGTRRRPGWLRALAAAALDRTERKHAGGGAPLNLLAWLSARGWLYAPAEGEFAAAAGGSGGGSSSRRTGPQPVGPGAADGAVVWAEGLGGAGAGADKALARQLVELFLDRMQAHWRTLVPPPREVASALNPKP